MDVLKDIVQVLATTALLWAGRHPNQLLPPPPTPTQPLVISIPTVTVYPPSRCLPLPSYPSMPGASASDGQIFLQILVLLFGLSIFGFFSLGLGVFCLSIRGTQDSPHLHTSPSSEASTTVDRAIDRVAEAWTEPEVDDRKTIQELSVKIQNLEGQIMDKAAEIMYLKLHHEYQVASTWSDFEIQKSHWAAAQRALEVEGQNTVADLRAKIARLEQQVDSHNTAVEQLTAGHQTELETVRSNHHSALQVIQELSVKIQNLDGQITVKAAEIKSLELHHEYQLTSTWSVLESRKSHWEAAQRALKVEGQNKVADLRAKIAQLEEQVDSHNATVEEAAVEQVPIQNDGPESPGPSRNSTNESESVEPSLPEQDLSASMWATSRRPVEHEPSPRPDWAAEAARARQGHNGLKKNKNAAQNPKGGQRRPRGGPDRQEFATAPFSTGDRIASGRAGSIKTTKNSHKDVRQISREGEYKYHDDRRS